MAMLGAWSVIGTTAHAQKHNVCTKDRDWVAEREK